jgi:FtsP/CotA-like multicopper oxidase with cupredoxin domain
MLSVSLRAAICLALLAGHVAVADPELKPDIVKANDNRSPAGILKKDTLRIHLVVRMARWYPEAASGPYVDVPVFAEKARTPSIPGPLIRVHEGTTIIATVANELSDSTVSIHGLATRPAVDDSTSIRPGENHVFTFSAGKPGTYFYYAKAGTVNWKVREREQLSGAFVVDPRGARVNDRILMINIWGDPVDSTSYDNALAINGKSWPFTERFSANIGDSLHWKVINASVRPHPMHLHGFYFRIDAAGTQYVDTSYAPDRRELAVTKHMSPGTTMDITWSPNRPGNWLFHCHFTFHVNEGARLGFRPMKGDMHMDVDPMKHMSGLVVGISVNDPRHAWHRPDSSVPLRKLRLYADDRPETAKSQLVTSYVLQRDDKAPARDSVEPAGQLIVLTQHQPTDVTIINRAHAPTSVHWHGIELESYNDGVAGWSGAMKNVAPMIAPNDSFTARLILPRAGTFIYHTHLNDLEQITSGAYGPIVVIEPGKKFDSERDHVVTLGWMTKGSIALNGDSVPPPMVLKYGLTHRLRLINIGAATRFTFALRQDSTFMTWRPVARDGADLPEATRVAGKAARPLSTGETFDVEWNPPARGEYLLTVANSGKVFNKMKVLVR